MSLKEVPRGVTKKKFNNEDTSKSVRCSKISVLKSMCYFKFIKKKKKTPPCFKLIHVIHSNSTNICKSTNQVNMLNVQRSINLNTFQGFPNSSSWWLRGKESACQFSGHEFYPWSRKIPYTAEQLISCPETTEPVLQSPGNTTTKPTAELLKPVLRSKRSPSAATREQPLLAATREKPRQQRRPSTAKNKLP